MKSRKLLDAGLLTACLAAYPVAGSAALIDFQAYAAGTVITSQYAEATFAAGVDQVLISDQPSYAGTGGRFICTGVGGLIDCTQDVIVTFTNPVSNLTFDSVGDNLSAGSVGGRVDVFVGGVYSSTLDIIGDGITLNTDLVDLSAFSNITSIRIHSVVDPAGLGFDNFSFDVNAQVPEPSSALLLGAGLLGWLGVTRKRRSPLSGKDEAAGNPVA